jgi:hypothetical protein
VVGAQLARRARTLALTLNALAANTPRAHAAPAAFARASARRRLLSVEYDTPEAADSRAKLAAVARAALRADATSRTLLMERCEGEFLELIELIPSAANYKKKEARHASRACGRSCRGAARGSCVFRLRLCFRSAC